MAIRERLREETYTGSRKRNSTGVISTSTYVSKREYCEDISGTPGDNDHFLVESTSQSGGLLSGGLVTNNYLWFDYPALYFVSDPYRNSHLGVGTRPSNGALAELCIARTNPSRSSMEALENLADLKSLPGEGKRLWNIGIKQLLAHTRISRWNSLAKVAKYELMLQFGLIPLLSDFTVLLDFQRRVDQRVDEIERLRTRGLRRTVDLWDGSSTATKRNQTVQSEGNLVEADVIKHTTQRVRGHIRWYADSNWLKSDETVRAVAKRVILGAYIDPTALYELMPWSWLIDYFTNLGTFVQASRNQFDAHHDKVRIMVETTTRTRAYKSVPQASKLVLTDFESWHYSKTRAATTPSLAAHIGFLNANQWSILGSLAVLRGGPSGPHRYR